MSKIDFFKYFPYLWCKAISLSEKMKMQFHKQNHYFSQQLTVRVLSFSFIILFYATVNLYHFEQVTSEAVHWQ